MGKKSKLYMQDMNNKCTIDVFKATSEKILSNIILISQSIFYIYD